MSELLAQLTERWDGKGPLHRAKGEQIHLPVRIVHVAGDAALQCLLGGVEHAAHLMRQRAGHAFDPEVATWCAEHATELLVIGTGGSIWGDVLAGEPSPQLALDRDGIDHALGAMGSFADLVSPYLSGHSIGVGDLAGMAAQCCGIDAEGAAAVRRAGYLHDLGRVAVHPRIWQKPGLLTADELKQVRPHPYHTERVLSRSPFFSAPCPIADAHHERLDGSGYHRGVNGPVLGLPARLLAAADAYHAMTEPRPHRAAHPPEEAARLLAEGVKAGNSTRMPYGGTRGGGSADPAHRTPCRAH
jgi:HD-GYP domain-containing protein (c-di-GMP phosphodiesterase class II)